MTEFASRFERFVDRTGDHHVWIGARDPSRGNGRFRVDGRIVTAHRVAWELAHGPLPPGAKVRACPDEPGCVRTEHLSTGPGTTAAAAPPAALIAPTPMATSRKRSRRGSGSMKEVRPGVWRLAVTGRNADGSSRRVFQTVSAGTEREASIELARLVTEVHEEDGVVREELRDLTFDAGIRRYLYEHLLEEKGRDPRTVDGYWQLHLKWFAPMLGRKVVRDLSREMFDKRFGAMRSAGISRSRMNQARSMYVPFFRWAVHRGITRRHILREFELPTSTHVARTTTPPEVEEVARLLAAAFEVTPDIAELLVLGATSGMRRGELVGLRESSLRPHACEVRVSSAVAGRRVKSTKTRRERDVSVDDATMAMLQGIVRTRRELAAAAGATVAADPFLFSLTVDSSKPMDPDHLTKRVAVLKEHLGIHQKRPETIALEDEALRLYRSDPAARRGRSGPRPQGGRSYADIGAQLHRTEVWARKAVQSALRREAAPTGDAPPFDGSVLALRKFTSSELLDAGFSVSAVAERQGHGPQVLVKHYGKRRRSADRRAAEHLGAVVHGSRSTARQ
jgi:integrase